VLLLERQAYLRAILSLFLLILLIGKLRVSAVLLGISFGSAMHHAICAARRLRAFASPCSTLFEVYVKKWPACGCWVVMPCGDDVDS
jgi:hypothetical protein